MRDRRKAIWIGMAAALVMLGNRVTAYAGTAITDIQLTFYERYDESGDRILEPQVTAGSDGYTIEELRWETGAENWQPGVPVSVQVRLDPERGKTFYAAYADDRVSVLGAEYGSVKREQSGALLLEADYRPVVQLGETEKAGWSDSAKTRASWTAVPYATAYQLKLYRGEGDYVTTLTLGTTSVDLSSYITAGSRYYYEVRAISKNSADAVYRRSGRYVTSAETDPPDGGGSREKWLRTRDGWQCTDGKGQLISDGWRYIGGVWYYFNEEGYAVTGWNRINGRWYYMDSDCRTKTGWLELEGQWYYLDSTGRMVTGWHQMSPGIWYYFNEDGTMVRDSVVDGRKIGSDGRRI